MHIEIQVNWKKSKLFIWWFGLRDFKVNMFPFTNIDSINDATWILHKISINKQISE